MSSGVSASLASYSERVLASSECFFQLKVTVLSSLIKSNPTSLFAIFFFHLSSEPVENEAESLSV